MKETYFHQLVSDLAEIQGRFNCGGLPEEYWIDEGYDTIHREASAHVLALVTLCRNNNAHVASFVEMILQDNYYGDDTCETVVGRIKFLLGYNVVIMSHICQEILRLELPTGVVAVAIDSNGMVRYQAVGIIEMAGSPHSTKLYGGRVNFDLPDLDLARLAELSGVSEIHRHDAVVALFGECGIDNCPRCQMRAGPVFKETLGRTSSEG